MKKMKICLVLTLALLMVAPSFAAPKKKVKDTMETVGIRYLDENFKVYDRLQKEIHAYAEPGYLEFKSSKALADHLEAHGFKIEMGVAGIPTAFIATYGSGKPVIGLLGEFDALPGMSQDTSAVKHPLKEGAAGHACGHNLLGVGPVASAVAISKWLAEGHQGTVKFFGCPAEEGGGGKGYMVVAGCFKDCDAILDNHPSSSNGVGLGGGLSNVRVKFSFSGVSAHAGGAPWKGRSALDGVEAFNYMMNLMREHCTTDTRIHYIITNGGQAPNVVPNFAQVEYYLRAARGTDVLKLFERALAAAKGAAMGTGTTMTYEIINGSYEKLMNEKLGEICLKNLKRVGGVILDEREKAFCSEVMKNSGIEPDLSNFSSIQPELGARVPGGGSTDVGNVSQVVPTITLRTSCFTKAGGGHCWQNAAVGGTTVGTKGAMVVAKTHYLTALDLYMDSSLLGPIWDEYYSFQGKDYKYIPLQGDRKPPLDYCK